jgi:hypothetical protein
MLLLPKIAPWNAPVAPDDANETKEAKGVTG